MSYVIVDNKRVDHPFNLSLITGAWLRLFADIPPDQDLYHQPPITPDGSQPPATLVRDTDFITFLDRDEDAAWGVYFTLPHDINGG